MTLSVKNMINCLLFCKYLSISTVKIQQVCRPFNRTPNFCWGCLLLIQICLHTEEEEPYQIRILKKNEMNVSHFTEFEINFLVCFTVSTTNFHFYHPCNDISLPTKIKERTIFFLTFKSPSGSSSLISL